MIDSIMYLGIGFLAAGLSLLMVVPFVHGRAVRLTTRRVEDAQPSRAEVVADKDLQRAAFALSIRRIEIKLQELKDKHAFQLAELGRKTDVVNQLRMETDGLRDLLRKAECISISKTNEARELRRVASQQGSDLVETTAALEVARCQLEEEQTTFAGFRDRIAAFMREVAAQINQEKERDLRLQQDLQYRLRTQSQLLSVAECERNQLRQQLEIAHDAAHAIRTEVVEVEQRVIAEVNALKRENNRLHGTLHRANGERTRLAYELAKTQVRDSRAA